jgi:long-chain acyl-CoA synthetase
MTQKTEWGTEIVTSTVRGFPCLVYRERCKSLVDVLASGGRWGSRPFLVQDERRLSYAELDDSTRKVAAHLESLGVRPGDRVMLFAANSLEWVVTFWSVIRLGGIVVLANAWWSGRELEAAARTVEPRLILVDERRSALAVALAPVIEVDSLTPLIEGTGSGVAAPASPPVDEDDPAVILFTSGTTGSPKGAVLSHRSVIANQHNFLAVTRRLPSQLSDDQPAIRSLFTAPLFHTGGVQAILNALLTGGTLVFLNGRFDPGRVLETIERERIDVWAGVPTMVQRVLDDPGIESRDLSSLRAIGLGGAPLPRPLVERAASAFPGARRGVTANYGMTEAGGIIASAGGRDVADHPGTSGKPLPAVELRIDARTGSDRGEILTRSAALMTGYWHESESPIDAEGWLRTGDIGRLDDEGFLYVVDRVKDLVIRGGENIASANVEEALRAHPAVAEAAVVGLPHPDLGEEVAAVVVTARGAQVTPGELANFAAERLAHFEVPARWWIRDEPLPLNPAGKTDKRSLKASWPDNGSR